MSMREKLINLAIYHKGNYNKILKAISTKKWVSPQMTQFKTVVIYDKFYPKSYYRLQYPPLVLFYEGNIDLYNHPCISVVGSRTLDLYSERTTTQLVDIIKKKYVIVSGCAKGIDTIAHQSALNGGKTIGILGCGLDILYPKCNHSLIETIKQKHCLVSEFPDGVQPLKHHFPWRNRLIAASSHSLWVMSGKIKSGTMHTINQAMELDNEIYALPHPYQSELSGAPHLSVNQGATLLNKEVIEDLMNQEVRSSS